MDKNVDWFAYAVLQKNQRNDKLSASSISETEQQLFEELQSAAERFTLIQRTHDAQEIKHQMGKQASQKRN